VRVRSEWNQKAQAGGEVVRQGWLHRSVGKSSWKKSWVVVKYKYLYYYSNPDVRTCLARSSLLPYSPLLSCMAQCVV
jgi:hypothetical protein